MKRILAFAGSNHRNSINHQLVGYAASLVDGAEVEVLDIRDWDVTMYSINLDPDQTPDRITELIGKIQNADGFIIASPEHNGAAPAFLKNILDWLSRRAKKVFDSKPVVLLSTSPGGGGGATNLKSMAHTLPYQGANVVASYSLPAFQDNFKDGKVVNDLSSNIESAISTLKEALD